MATFYERFAASRHYCQRTSDRVQKLKVTKIVDTDSQAVRDVHCSTNRDGSDADLAEQIEHRVFAPDDHAHNARIDDERYNQRSMNQLKP